MNAMRWVVCLALLVVAPADACAGGRPLPDEIVAQGEDGVLGWEIREFAPHWTKLDFRAKEGPVQIVSVVIHDARNVSAALVGERGPRALRDGREVYHHDLWTPDPLARDQRHAFRFTCRYKKDGVERTLEGYHASQTVEPELTAPKPKPSETGSPSSALPATASPKISGDFRGERAPTTADADGVVGCSLRWWSESAGDVERFFFEVKNPNSFPVVAAIAFSYGFSVLEIETGRRWNDGKQRGEYEEPPTPLVQLAEGARRLYVLRNPQGGVLPSGVVRFTRRATRERAGAEVVDTLRETAQARARAGDLVGALEALDAAIEAQPNHVFARMHRAELRLASGNASGAAADYDAAFQRDSANVGALVGRAIARQRSGKLDEALADAELASTLDSTLDLTRELIDRLRAEVKAADERKEREARELRERKEREERDRAEREERERKELAELRERRAREEQDRKAREAQAAKEREAQAEAERIAAARRPKPPAGNGVVGRWVNGANTLVLRADQTGEMIARSVGGQAVTSRTPFNWVLSKGTTFKLEYTGPTVFTDSSGAVLDERMPKQSRGSSAYSLSANQLTVFGQTYTRE